MRTFTTLVKASTARMMEIFAVEQARDIFGFDCRYRVRPNYSVSMYGYPEKIPGAFITVDVVHKKHADASYKLYWDTDETIMVDR